MKESLGLKRGNAWIIDAPHTPDFIKINLHVSEQSFACHMPGHMFLQVPVHTLE